MAVFVSRLTATVSRLGAHNVVAGTRAVRGASAAVHSRVLSTAAVHSRALSTAAAHDAPFCLASPPPADPEALRSRWREEALNLLATSSASPDDDRSRWREQCLAIAGGAEAPAPPRESHELGGYFS